MVLEVSGGALATGGGLILTIGTFGIAMMWFL
jgi:hypothetical protein